MRGVIRGILLAAIAAMLAFPMPELSGAEARATPPPPMGDWVVNDTTAVSDTSIILNGNLRVESAGMLTLTNVDLTVNCNYPGQFRIDVSQGGELRLIGCNLSSATASRGYHFRAAPGSILEILDSRVSGAGTVASADGMTNGILVLTSNVVITGSIFRGNLEALHARDCALAVSDCTFSDNAVGIAASNCSLSVTGCLFENSNASGLSVNNGSDAAVLGCRFRSNFRYGIYVNSSTATVSGGSFSENYIGFHAEYSSGSGLTGCSFQSEKYAGIRFWECPDGTVADCNVNASKRIALYAAGSHVQAVNTPFVSGMYDGYLEGGSLVELVNCTLNSNNLFFHDESDRINVSWYLNIQVLWWSSEEPVPGAAINVTDQAGSPMFVGATDAQGRLNQGIVRGYSMNMSGLRTFGPYTANATKSGLWASTTTWVNGTMELRLLLDDIGPAMIIRHPAPGSYVNSIFVTFSGVAWDNETRVATIEGAIDSGSWIVANGTSSWSFTAFLTDGPHVVRIRGTDTSNNINIASSDFTVDTRAPALSIASPANGSFTRQRSVNITGVTEPNGNATVMVGGVPADIDNATGNFSAMANLTEGDNTIRVEAEDLAGNIASFDLHIRSDTMVTPFDIYPLNGTWSNRSVITVNGTVEPGSVLVLLLADSQGNFTSNGTTLNITSGNFSVNMTLHNGTNLLLVEAFDGFGNSAESHINVTLDMVPPAITLTSPPSGEYYTHLARVVFSGWVEPDASLFLNGRVVLVSDGGFNQSKPLQVGSNQFTLTAMDRAGNVRTLVFNITFDRTAPSLVIKSPKNGAKTTGDSILVKGTTEMCATVMVNGKTAKVGASGNFQRQVSLRMGHNSIDIVATDLAGNPTSEHIVVDRSPAPPILYDWQIGILTIVLIVCVFLGIVAWDTRRTTGRYALARPAWLRVPARVMSYIPRPVFGREEFDSGPGAVSGAPRKEEPKPSEHGAPAPGAPAGPPAQPAEPLPAARLGDEFIVSEKHLTAQPGTMPAATEVPAQLPLAEPVRATAAPAANIMSGAASGPAAPAVASAQGTTGPAGPSAPVQPPAPAAPSGPPEPQEPDPLAEILGHPTKRL